MRTTLALVLTLVTAAPVWAQGGPPIRVGFASAMSGPSAITGEGVRWGATMVVEEINARGGVAGRKIEAYFADNKGTPGEAVSAVRKLVDVDNVDVIVGQTHSGACLGAMPIVKELQVPMVIESCSNPKIRDLSGKGGNEWVFRVNLDDAIMATTFARYIAKQGVKTVSLVAQNDDFGRGAAAAYDASFKKAGVKVLSQEFFDRGQADYRPLLTRLKRTNPEALLGVILASDASVFLRQFRELGLTQKIYARGSVASAEFLHQVRDNPSIGDGVVEASYWVAGLDPQWDKQWLERWKSPVRVHGSMAAIAFRHAVVPAIEMAAKSGRVDRKSLREALAKVNVKDTVVGPIRFDDHHQAYINMLLLELRNGEIRILDRLPTQPE
jgi:branched-chain amino acid transport system substrate-binding protein